MNQELQEDSILENSHEDVTETTVMNSLQNIVLSLNRKAMEHLKVREPKEALKLLKQALVVLAMSSKEDATENLNFLTRQLYGLTHNNLGCVYKSEQDYDQALENLKLALTYESTIENYDQTQLNNSAGTIVNICTILSLKKLHKMAVKFARQAIKRMDVAVKDGAVTVHGQPANQNIQATAVIAYFNAAVQYEHLGQWDRAKLLYESASTLLQASTSNEAQVQMQRKINKALQLVNIKVRAKVQREPERRLKPVKVTPSEIYTECSPTHRQKSPKPSPQKPKTLTLNKILNQLEDRSIVSSVESSRHHHSIQQQFDFNQRINYNRLFSSPDPSQTPRTIERSIFSQHSPERRNYLDVMSAKSKRKQGTSNSQRNKVDWNTITPFHNQSILKPKVFKHDPFVTYGLADRWKQVVRLKPIQSKPNHLQQEIDHFKSIRKELQSPRIVLSPIKPEKPELQSIIKEATTDDPKILVDAPSSSSLKKDPEILVEISSCSSVRQSKLAKQPVSQHGNKLSVLSSHQTKQCIQTLNISQTSCVTQVNKYQSLQQSEMSNISQITKRRNNPGALLKSLSPNESHMTHQQMNPIYVLKSIDDYSQYTQQTRKVRVGSIPSMMSSHETVVNYGQYNIVKESERADSEIDQVQSSQVSLKL